MTRTAILRVIFGLMIIVLGNLQAWDSDVYEAGLWTDLLVSAAIALPAITILLPLQQIYFLSALVLSLILLVIARVTSPLPLPGHFIILVPAAMGLFLAVLPGEKGGV